MQWTVDDEGCYHLQAEKGEAILVPTFTDKWRAVVYVGAEKVEKENSSNLTAAKRWASRILIPVNRKQATMKNRKLVVAGVYLSDVAEALEEHGISLTEENIKAAARHVENIASAWAKATLQDTSREDWLDWIETFKEQGKC